MSIKHTRHKIITVKTSPSKLLNVLQNEPLEYLRISGVAVEETLQAFKAGDTTGEWMVVEKLSIPLIPSTTFKTKFTRIDKGCLWNSWASLGVLVENTYTIDDTSSKANEEQQNEPPTSHLVEKATLTCPFFVYPLVRWQFNTNHDKNLIKLQEYFQ